MHVAHGSFVEEIEVIFTDRTCGEDYTLSCEMTYESSCSQEIRNVKYNEMQRCKWAL